MDSGKNEIKGSFGSSFTELTSSGPFYSCSVRLVGIGRVTKLPDIKQGFDSLSTNTRKGPWRVNLLN